jgi:hypothetical protein
MNKREVISQREAVRLRRKVAFLIERIANLENPQWRGNKLGTARFTGDTLSYVRGQAAFAMRMDKVIIARVNGDDVDLYACDGRIS